MGDENLPNRDWLPEDLRFNDGLSKFNNAGSLGKSYLELEKKMGSSISLPKDDSKPEEFDKFYKSWGRPEKFEEYKIPELPENLKIDDEFGGSVKSLAHKMGLNQRQFSQLIEWGKEQSLGMLSQQERASQESQGKLKSEWGFRYNDNTEKAHKALAMLVGFKEDHPFLKYLETNKMGDSPEFMKFLLEFHDRMGEDKFVDSQTKTAISDRTDAKKKIAEIRADTKHPYFNEQDPRHKDAVIEMNRLYEIVYNDEK